MNITRFFDILMKREGKISADLLILDDVFPIPLSPFRYTEYTGYLRYFPKSAAISTLTWNPNNEKDFSQATMDAYLKKHPDLLDKIHLYKKNLILKSKLIYVNFINNAKNFDLGFSLKIPFIINLYPGGGFYLNQEQCDLVLRKYLASEFCKKVIATQKITLDYLLKKKFCPPEKIEYISGVVTPPELLIEKNIQKCWFGSGKNTLDICFVAHQYTPGGVDKGYDTFIRAAEILIKKYDDIIFHVVGSFDANTLDVTSLSDRIKFYGLQANEWFKEFYLNKDIIVSPNVPFVLHPGAFDGFPTASVTDAGLNEVVMFASDELGLNDGRFASDELVIIKPDASDVVDKIEYFLNHPDMLSKFAKNGAKRIRSLYAYEKQIKSRIDIIEDVLSTDAKKLIRQTLR